MTRRVFRWIAPALLCSAAAGAILDAAPPAAIAVSVLDDTGMAVPGARVFLTGITDSVHRVTEADQAGQALFDHLPGGEFTLAAEKDGFARGRFGPAGVSGQVSIALAEGAQFNATVVLQRLGGIAGTVSDEKGAPLSAEVRLLKYQVGSSGRRLQLVASSRASANGAFNFSSVVPGDYFVCARALGTSEAAALLPVPACFGGSREPSGAANLRVAPADLAGNVNLFLTFEPAARLQGKVLDSSGQPVPSTQVHIARAVDDGFGIVSVRTGPAGDFAAGLLPGTYNLVVRGAGSIETTLTSGTTNEVTFPLGTGATFSGRLSLEPAGTSPGLPAGATIAELVPAASAHAHLMQTIPVTLADAGSLTFRAAGIPPGDYQLRMHTAASQWLPASALTGDRELLAEGIRILGTDQITDSVLSLVNADAQLTGRVVGPDDTPVFDRKVLLFPADRKYWASAFGRVRWAQPDTNGRFEITGLPAGRFLLALIAEATGEEWTPALLEATASDALPISLEPGQRLVQAIRTTGR